MSNWLSRIQSIYNFCLYCLRDWKLKNNQYDYSLFFWTKINVASILLEYFFTIALWNYSRFLPVKLWDLNKIISVHGPHEENTPNIVFLFYSLNIKWTKTIATWIPHWSYNHYQIFWGTSGILHRNWPWQSEWNFEVGRAYGGNSTSITTSFKLVVVSWILICRSFISWELTSLIDVSLN